MIAPIQVQWSIPAQDQAGQVPALLSIGATNRYALLTTSVRELSLELHVDEPLILARKLADTPAKPGGRIRVPGQQFRDGAWSAFSATLSLHHEAEFIVLRCDVIDVDSEPVALAIHCSPASTEQVIRRLIESAPSGPRPLMWTTESEIEACIDRFRANLTTTLQG